MALRTSAGREPPKGRPLSAGPSLPAWATRGLAGLLLVGAVGLPWLATWQGVMRRPEVQQVVRAPELVQYRPELVLVPGGKFRMGSSAAERTAFARELPEGRRNEMDDEHEHDAEVAPLYMCRTEVTRAQWRAVMDSVPAECTYGCEDEHPVGNIDWNEACHYMVELTRRENEARTKGGEPALTACYAWDGATCAWTDPACTGFRLPTETEWEYVARAGTTTAYSFGDDPKDMCKFGNGADRSAKAKRPDWEVFAQVGSVFDCDDGQADLALVGRYAANPWGLHDMYGNLGEWVWDWYGDDQEVNAASVGYAGPSSGGARVMRGGSFWSGPWQQRAAERSWAWKRNEFVGLRCVRSSRPAEARESVVPDGRDTADTSSCTNYIGQATAAEIAKSPFADAEAEVLAIEVSGKLVAPEHIYQRIVLDLSTIRGQNPEVQNIKAMVSWAPDELVMDFDAKGIRAVQDGTYTDWDCANARYGFKSKEVVASLDILHFSHKLNAPLLAKEYSAFSHVDVAEPTRIMGDDNDVCVSIEGDTTFHYVFDAGSGDCPSGCMRHTYWGFTSKGSPAMITSLGKFSKDQGDPPAWFSALSECTRWL